MRVGVYTLKETLFNGEAEKVIARTTAGEITVLENHLPFVTTLAEGILHIVEKGGTEKTFKLKGGVIEVRPESHVVILAS